MPEDISYLIIFNLLTISLLVVSLISISKKVNYIAILMTCFLWGLIPWPFLYLKDTIKSVLMITLTRILITIIGTFIFIVITFFLNSYYKRKGTIKSSWFQYSFKDFKMQIKSYLPSSLHENHKHKLHLKISYNLYYFLLGFTYFISILFYFFCFQKLGVVFTSIVYIVATTIIVAFWNLARRFEYLDSIKISYLSILMIAGILTIVSASQASIGSMFSSFDIKTVLSTPFTIQGESGLFGVISLVITTIFWVFFIILSGMDEYTTYEKQRLIKFTKKNTNFQITKSMVKMFFFFIFSLLSLVIFVLILAILPLNISTIKNEITFFMQDLYNFPSIISNVWTLALGVECTIFPYLIYFLSQNNWPKGSLKWDQWVSILGVTETFISIFVGFFIGNEAAKFDLVILIIATITLSLTMLLRYYHEKNSLKSIILLKIKPKHMKKIVDNLKINTNIIELETVTGEYDIILKTFFQSNYLLRNFIEKLKNIEGILEIENLIEFQLKKG